jgi:monoamine oxidase
VICALPFSLLRDVEVTPPFSAGKRRAVATLSQTAVCRVWIPTEGKRWTPAPPVGGRTALEVDMANTDLGAQWIYDAGVIQPGPGAVIGAYMAGERARAASALGEDERRDATVRMLAAVYPGLGDPVAEGASKCWTTDPWARGGYCWFRPGEMQALGDHVRTPEGRVHFAGDHTSPAPGWMEGAIESGLRAAKEVETGP